MTLNWALRAVRDGAPLSWSIYGHLYTETDQLIGRPRETDQGYQDFARNCPRRPRRHGAGPSASSATTARARTVGVSR